MNIGALRTRITFEKNTATTDEYGNHTSTWATYFTCWATASKTGRTADEAEAAGHTVEKDRLMFTVRYCSETACITSKEYRIILGDRIYDIVHVDDMGFKGNSLKFEAVLRER